MRLTIITTILLVFSTSFLFAQNQSKPEKVVVKGKTYSNVTKVETDKSKVKMLSPNNNKSVILKKDNKAVIEPKKK